VFDLGVYNRSRVLLSAKFCLCCGLEKEELKWGGLQIYGAANGRNFR
jgi:hypothetical protein